MSEETIVQKHMKILREGYKNNKAQMLQAKEQAEAQLEQATKTIEIIEGEFSVIDPARSNTMLISSGICGKASFAFRASKRSSGMKPSNT